MTHVRAAIVEGVTLSRSACIVLGFVACAAPSAPVPERPAPTPRAAAPAPRFDYPVSRRETAFDRLHGVTVPDPYRWLESENPEVTAWLEAQDARTQRVLAPLEADVEARWQRILALGAPIKEPREIVRGRRRFVRKPGESLVELTARGEVMRFDSRSLPAGTRAVAVHLAPDGNHAAIELSKSGADMRELRVMAVDSGQVLETLTGIESTPVVWHGRRFFYTHTPLDAPHAERFGQRAVRVHEVGTDPAHDRTVVPASGDANATPVLTPVAVTKDGRRVLVHTGGGWDPAASAYALVDLRSFVVTPLQQPGTRLESACVVGNAIVAILERAGERLLARLEGTDWKVQSTLDERVLGVSAIGSYLVLEHARGTQTLREIYDEKLQRIASRTSAAGESEWFSDEPMGREIVIAREGLLLPPERIALDPVTGTTRALGRAPVAFDASRFVQEELTAISRDGTKVPLVVIRPHDRANAASLPAWMYGYGGFRVSAEQRFWTPWVGFYDGGGIFAQCHGRGGLEFGEPWHAAGARTHRQHGIDDLIACLETLHAHGLSTPSRTLLQGWSHGGMMVAAVAMQRPELQALVLATVPLTDMVRFARFGRGGVTEYGDVEQPADFAALWAFSPYHHVREGVAYPKFVITAAQHDERVAPLHARKLTAALQHASGGEVLLAVDWDGGHLGGGKRDAKRIFATAASLAWSLGGARP